MPSSPKRPDRQMTPVDLVPKLERVKLFGIEWPIPRWAVGFGAFVLLLGMVAFLTDRLVLPAIKHWETRHDSPEDPQLKEWERHFNETPVGESDNIGGVLNVKLYGSDGCLLVSRKSGRKSEAEVWVLDLSRVEREPAPGRISRSGALPWEGTAWAWASGNCLNPHPGNFEQSEGQRRDCWVQIFRKWPDGCVQYQWYDSCFGVWDKNPDGTPKIFWETCHH